MVIVASCCRSKKVGRPGHSYLGLRGHLNFLEYSFIARRYGRCWDYRPFVGTCIAVVDVGRVTPLGEQPGMGRSIQKIDTIGNGPGQKYFCKRLIH